MKILRNEEVFFHHLRFAFTLMRHSDADVKIVFGCSARLAILQEFNEENKLPSGVIVVIPSGKEASQPNRP